jgi:hypothetical protein
VALATSRAPPRGEDLAYRAMRIIFADNPILAVDPISN